MDIYAEITNRIVSEMENGLIPWQKPWVASGGCVSYATGKPYSLLNVYLQQTALKCLNFTIIGTSSKRKTSAREGACLRVKKFSLRRKKAADC